MTDIAPPVWAERKAKEQLTSEWSRRMGHITPVSGEPLEVELVQVEEADLGCDPPFVVRPQPVIYVNGVCCSLDQAAELAGLIIDAVQLVASRPQAYWVDARIRGCRSSTGTGAGAAHDWFDRREL